MAQHPASQKRRVTLIGALVNLGLACLKILVGWLGHSQALVADGVHSLSDLVSDVLVLSAAHFGSQAADKGHPYGHQRFETVATVGIGLLLLAVAGGFIYDAALRLMEPASLAFPGWIVLPAAVTSVLAKEALYQYTVRVGRRARSKLIEANAWHHRSDALSSLIVIGGVLGALAGFPWFDAVAAIIVAVMVGLMGWRFMVSALRELVDTGLEYDQLEEMGQLVDSVDGVQSHHDLRSRLMGDHVLLDVHIVVNGDLSVLEGHRIGEEVEQRLQRYFEGGADVLVHVDPMPEQMNTE